MRTEPTSAERKLWRALRRSLPLQGTHFRRQVVLDGVIVDLCCLAARLVVEIDGATHSTREELARDGRRTRRLEALGFRVLRVTNAEVFDAIESVLETIRLAVEEQSPFARRTPTPYPSPEGGGGTVGGAACDERKRVRRERRPRRTSSLSDQSATAEQTPAHAPPAGRDVPPPPCGEGPGVGVGQAKGADTPP